MNSRDFSSGLSQTHARLVEALGLNPPVREKMICEPCEGAGGDCMRGGPYRADLKCCTFQPFIPNFLVGAILADATLAARMRETLSSGPVAVPLGVVPPAAYQVAFHDHGPAGFGQQEKLLCSFFDRSRNHCSIWSERPSTCATYYCKSSYGTRGIAFWAQADELLHQVDLALSQHAALEAGFLWPEIQACLPYLPGAKAPGAPLSVARQKKLWSDLHGTECEFFMKCFEYVAKLEPAELRAAIGPMESFDL